MNKTNIEWVKNPDGSQGYTWNPITGCLNHNNGLCKGGGFPCYAYKLANGRLKSLYSGNGNIPPTNETGYRLAKGALNPFYPRFWEERLAEPIEHPEPMHPVKRKGIFVCDMGELFGDWLPNEWVEQIMTTIKLCPYHRFYLLTKQPQNLPQFSPFPDNCWVGVTATNETMFYEACHELHRIRAKLKYISFEPLLRFDHLPDVLDKNKWIYWWLLESGINWLIIGACTGTKKDMEELCKRYPNLTPIHWKGNLWTAQPRIEDLREIVEAADKAGIKVFLKDNLYPLYLGNPQDSCHFMFKNARLRQEMPSIPSE